MSNAKSISTEIEKANSALSALKQEQLEITKSVVESIKDLIQSSEFISRLSWTQYSPHFNDGDACEFDVHEVEFRFTEATVKVFNERGFKVGYNKRDFEVDEDYSTYQIQEIIDVINFTEFSQIGALVDNISEFNDFIQENPEGLKEAFGDHAKVIVTKDGIEVEEYEHD